MCMKHEIILQVAKIMFLNCYLFDLYQFTFALESGSILKIYFCYFCTKTYLFPQEAIPVSTHKVCFSAYPFPPPPHNQIQS